MPAEVNVSKLMPLKKCPLCHGTERKRLFNLNLYGVYECSGCRLRYIDPCLSSEGMQELYSSTENLKALNQFHSTYYEYGDPDVTSKTVKDFGRALSLLEGLISGSERSVFDVGCGNGLFVTIAQKRGWLVSGCDSSIANVSLAATKYGVKVSCSSFDQWEPERRKYDAISFWDVLEHLADPHAFVHKAIAMLKPGGFVIVGGPNDRSLLQILASWLYRLSFGGVAAPLRRVYLLEHVSYFTEQTMTRLFGQYGFRFCESFRTNTDLEKYKLPFFEKKAASLILTMGSCLALQNRFVAIFQAPSGSDDQSGGVIR